MKLEYFSCVICALLLLTLHIILLSNLNHNLYKINKTNSLKTTLGDNGCWYDVFMLQI